MGLSGSLPHSTCGACGMLVNGVEKLTCITLIREVIKDGGTLKVEPLRNFPVISDLVVDMGGFYQKMERTQFGQVTPLKASYLPFEPESQTLPGDNYERLVDCIECGLCVSVCPAASTSSSYLGPAVLAGIQHKFLLTGNSALFDLADSQDGVWRCHSAFECSEVCPSNVDPAWRIMDLRQKIIGNRLAGLFGRKEAKHK
jgi:succinate dehydrogenase / fumarate reductase iron-sulfur subunit